MSVNLFSPLRYNNYQINLLNILQHRPNRTMKTLARPRPTQRQPHLSRPKHQILQRKLRLVFRHASQ